MFFSPKEIQAVPVRVLHGYCGYVDPGSGLYPCSTHTLDPPVLMAYTNWENPRYGNIAVTHGNFTIPRVFLIRSTLGMTKFLGRARTYSSHITCKGVMF